MTSIKICYLLFAICPAHDSGQWGRVQNVPGDLVMSEGEEGDNTAYTAYTGKIGLQLREGDNQVRRAAPAGPLRQRILRQDLFIRCEAKWDK